PLLTMISVTLSFSYGDLTHRFLLSFPTRRSSDLPGARFVTDQPQPCEARRSASAMPWLPAPAARAISVSICCSAAAALSQSAWRSEEHTSELQSRFDLVCRLLLEKKKRCDLTYIC